MYDNIQLGFGIGLIVVAIILMIVANMVYFKKANIEKPSDKNWYIGGGLIGLSVVSAAFGTVLFSKSVSGLTTRSHPYTLLS